MKEYIAPVLERRMMHYRTSWQWIRSDFAEEFKALEGTAALNEQGGISERIWSTRSKYVLKVASPKGRVMAYKTYRSLPGYRYLLAPTPVAREALNYQNLELLGIPMARVLAVGESRRCFWTQTAFFMTEFATGFQDGRCFTANGERSGDTALRDEFISRHLDYLAVLHDAGYFHRGFTFANLLWRELTEADAQGHHMELKWIDVATCRQCPSWLLKKKIPYDFGNLFRFVRLSPEQRRNFIAGYYDKCRIKRFGLNELVALTEKALAERLAKRGGGL